MVTIHTDHKPLVAVSKNSRHGSIRTERVKLRHQDITLSVQHIHGDQSPADFCSRHPTPFARLPNHSKQEANECEKLIYHTMSGGIITDIGADNLSKASRVCPQLSVLGSCIQEGRYPSQNDGLEHFKNVFHEMTKTKRGTILRGE